MEVYRKAAPVKMSEDAEVTEFLGEAKSFSNVWEDRDDCSLSFEGTERNRRSNIEAPFGRSNREQTDRRRAEREAMENQKRLDVSFTQRRSWRTVMLP